MLRSIWAEFKSTNKPDVGNELWWLYLLCLGCGGPAHIFKKYSKKSWSTDKKLVWDDKMLPRLTGQQPYAVRTNDWVNTRSVGLNSRTCQNSSWVRQNLLQKRIEFKYLISCGHLMTSLTIVTRLGYQREPYMLGDSIFSLLEKRTEFKYLISCVHLMTSLTIVTKQSWLPKRTVYARG